MTKILVIFFMENEKHRREDISKILFQLTVVYHLSKFTIFLWGLDEDQLTAWHQQTEK